MEAREVESLARVREMSVMLLEDLVETSEIQIHILLELQKILGGLIYALSCFLAHIAVRDCPEHLADLFHL